MSAARRHVAARRGVDIARRAEPRRLAVQVPRPRVPAPGRDRARLRRGGVAVPRGRRHHLAFGAGARGAHRRQGAHRRARGLPRRLADLAADRGLRRAAVPARRAAARRTRSTRCSSRCRASRRRARPRSPTSRRCRARWRCGGRSPPGSAASGSSSCSSPCCRACASAAARRCSRRSAAGPELGAGDDDPRGGAALRRALRRRSPRSRSPSSALFGLDRHRRPR